MQVEQIQLRKLVASEGKIIVSNSTHIDEETGEEVPDVQGKVIYLGKNDSEENYEEIDFVEENLEEVL